MFRLVSVRPGTGCKQLRGCPPAFGLLLYAAALFTPSARAEKWVGVQQLIAFLFTKAGQELALGGGALTKLPGAGRWCTQRSGIKEELSAIGRHGGQPRS
jgi:hypothetical protein